MERVRCSYDTIVETGVGLNVDTRNTFLAGHHPVAPLRYGARSFVDASIDVAGR